MRRGSGNQLLSVGAGPSDGGQLCVRTREPEPLSRLRFFGQRRPGLVSSTKTPVVGQSSSGPAAWDPGVVVGSPKVIGYKKTGHSGRLAPCQRQGLAGGDEAGPRTTRLNRPLLPNSRKIHLPKVSASERRDPEASCSTFPCRILHKTQHSGGPESGPAIERLATWIRVTVQLGVSPRRPMAV